MPCSHDFEYCKPKTLDEAQGLLKTNANARILAGGTDLAVHIKENIAKPDMVIDIKNIKELKKFEYQNNKLFIGSLVTFTEIIEADFVRENFIMLKEASETVASVGIRNRATLVGNLCSAVPSLDCGPTLLVYDADVVVYGSNKERRINIKDWFKAPRKTALNSDEIVVGIEIAKPAKKHSGLYVKLGRYRGEDLAQAGLGLLALEGDEYRLAYCAVGPVPKRLENVEQILCGKKLSPQIIAEAAEKLEKEIAPITDIRASKEYRTDMMKVMLERGLLAVKDRLDGKKIAHNNILGG